MFAKIIDEKTKRCDIAPGTNAQFYKSIGFAQMEIEQGYDGCWYLKGYAPEKPQEIKEQEVRAVRNQYLKQTDEFMIMDYPITDDERELYKQYRVYLRTYPECRDWYKANPKTYEEFIVVENINQNAE